jgi:hypothetical protein
LHALALPELTIMALIIFLEFFLDNITGAALILFFVNTALTLKGILEKIKAKSSCPFFFNPEAFAEKR